MPTLNRTIGVAVLVLGLAACGETDAATSEIGPGDEYVALGDSYTAARLTGPAAPSTWCRQSSTNYPRQIAEATGATLRDVSCGGSATGALFRPRKRAHDTVPPQLDALSSDTDLVTLRIGANDHALFRRLVRTCVEAALTSADPAPCQTDDTASGTSRLAGELIEIEHRIRAAIDEIRQRAPRARVLAIGYPDIVPESGNCEQLPLADGDYAFGHAVNIGLNRAIRSAAEDAGIGYVDVYAATAGHDICAEEPWVAGALAAQGHATPYHPYPEEQEATATAVLAALAE